MDDGAGDAGAFERRRQQVELYGESVDALAAKCEGMLGLGPAQLSDVVGLSDKQFTSLQLEPSMLGGFPTAAAVTSAHGTAHHVVLSTLQGVNEDLMAFAGYLDKAVEGLADADDLSASALDQLAQIRYGSAGNTARHDAQEAYVPPADS